MVYRTTKCPYCNFYLERNSTSNELEFMPSLLPCPKCHKVFKTGKKMWYEMSEKERKKKNYKYYGWTSYIYILIQNLFLMFFIVFIPTVLIGSLIFKFNDKLTFTIAPILQIVISILTIPCNIKKDRKYFEYWKNMTYEQFINKYYR